MTEQPTRPVQTATLPGVPDPGQRVHQGAALSLHELDPRKLLEGTVREGAFALLPHGGSALTLPGLPID